MTTHTATLRARAAEIERELREDGLPILIPTPKVCDILGASARTFARMSARGDLATSRAAQAGASRVFVRRGELARYLAAREHRAEPARA